MKIAMRRILRLAGMTTFLAILASPLAAPRLALGSSLVPAQHNNPCSSAVFAAGVLGYDADTQRCVFGSGGCDFHVQ